MPAPITRMSKASTFMPHALSPPLAKGGGPCATFIGKKKFSQLENEGSRACLRGRPEHRDQHLRALADRSRRFLGRRPIPRRRHTAGAAKRDGSGGGQLGRA